VALISPNTAADLSGLCGNHTQHTVELPAAYDPEPLGLNSIMMAYRDEDLRCNYGNDGVLVFPRKR
jgi:hypothetical protein